MALISVNSIGWKYSDDDKGIRTWISSVNEVYINTEQIASISEITDRGHGDGNYLANFAFLGLNQLEVDASDFEKIQLSSGGGGGGSVDPQQVKGIAREVVQEETPPIALSCAESVVLSSGPSIATSAYMSATSYIDDAISNDVPGIAVDNANNAIRTAISSGIELSAGESPYKLVIEDSAYPNP